MPSSILSISSLADAEGLSTHALADLLLSQPDMGTTIKTDGEDRYALVRSPPQVQDNRLHRQHSESLLLGAKGSMLRQKNSPPPEVKEEEPFPRLKLLIIVSFLTLHILRFATTLTLATISRYQTQTLMDSAVSDSASRKVDITSRTIASVLTNLAAVDVIFQVEEANISAPADLLVKVALSMYIRVTPPSSSSVPLNGYLLNDIADGAMCGLQPNNVRFRSVVAENHEKDDEEVVTTGVNAAAAGCRRSSFVVDFEKPISRPLIIRPMCVVTPIIIPAANGISAHMLDMMLSAQTTPEPREDQPLQFPVWSLEQRIEVPMPA
ncbi:hypothetical protein EDD22DRAFT_953411 [Suillus occidentalis]|nr:hypothetical protein EDD22DRAFT_953411 [Suillus occidentalis]